MKLLRKTALVTGGANGIGQAVARLFADEGANVAIADFDDSAGEQTASEIRSRGGTARFFHCDVSKAEEIRETLRHAVEAFGTIDILVNDAATQLNKPLLETSDEEFDQVIATNLRSTFLFTRDTAKLMIEHKHGGSIVNFSSTFAHVGSPGYLAYHASKGGIASMTRAAAIALMHRGARVAIAEDGFLAPPIRNLPDMLEMAGLHVEFEKRPFDPIRPEKPKADESGCCCGHHHHHDGESCGCGHHHDHEGHECCCGGHHHHEGEACGCGHHHDHEDHECCCGGHHHDDEACCCGHHHHHDGESCGCGHHHDHEDHECCCGGHRRENDGKSGCGQA